MTPPPHNFDHYARRLVLAASSILWLLLMSALVAQVAAQTVTPRLEALRVLKTKPDTHAQTLRWSVSGVTADSFVIHQSWVATGRNADKNGPPETAQGATRYKVSGGSRTKVLYWARHYGNTEARAVCVVPYRGGVPVVLGGATAPLAPTPVVWSQRMWDTYPPKGTASDTMFARAPARTSSVSGSINYATAALGSVQWLASSVWAAGSYTFTVRSDDGFRLYIDGVVVMDEYRPQGPTTFTKTVTLTNASHTLRVDYFNNDASGVLSLSWAFVPATGPVVDPSCAGAKASYSHWEPFRDVLFLTDLEPAVAAKGTLVLVGGWLPRRMSPRADSLCRQAASSSGLAQVVDLRSCMAAVDTAGAVFCLAVLDSAHSWGMQGVGNYSRCDETFYRALRGKRLTPP